MPHPDRSGPPPTHPAGRVFLVQASATTRRSSIVPAGRSDPVFATTRHIPGPGTPGWSSRPCCPAGGEQRDRAHLRRPAGWELADESSLHQGGTLLNRGTVPSPPKSSPRCCRAKRIPSLPTTTLCSVGCRRTHATCTRSAVRGPRAWSPSSGRRESGAAPARQGRECTGRPDSRAHRPRRWWRTDTWGAVRPRRESLRHGSQSLIELAQCGRQQTAGQYADRLHWSARWSTAWRLGRTLIGRAVRSSTGSSAVTVPMTS